MDDEPTFDLDAAGLRADGADVAVGIEVLARALEEALPQATRVHRRSKRLFGGDKVVESVEVRLGTTRYGLGGDGPNLSADPWGEGVGLRLATTRYVREFAGNPVSGDRRQEVRGVVIRREPLELSQWVGA